MTTVLSNIAELLSKPRAAVPRRHALPGGDPDSGDVRCGQLRRRGPAAAGRLPAMPRWPVKWRVAP